MSIQREEAQTASLSAEQIDEVPPNWQSVPIEPTEEMWKAGLDKFIGREGSLAEAWFAMLTAAPTKEN